MYCTRHYGKLTHPLLWVSHPGSETQDITIPNQPGNHLTSFLSFMEVNLIYLSEMFHSGISSAKTGFPRAKIPISPRGEPQNLDLC